MRLSLLLLLGALGVSAPVAAADPAAEPEVEQQAEQQAKRFEDAKRFFENGKLAYDVGRFDEAVLQFERAYALRPSPLLLFNMAQCYRHLGNAKKAVFLYDGFLREAASKHEPQMVIARDEVERLRAQVAAQEQREDAAASPPVEEEPSATPVPQEPVEPETSSDAVLWGAIGGGTLLVVALGATAVVAAVFASLPAPGEAGRLDLR